MTSAGRIKQVETLCLGTKWKDFSFVRIHTDEGLAGVGDITHSTRREQVCQAVEQIGARYILGADPFNVEAIGHRVLHGDGFIGGDIGGIALSGIDQALYDLLGQALGVPVYRLIGGACRSHLPVYANGWYGVPREPRSFANRACEVVEQGYRALKFDPFGTAVGELALDQRSQAIALVEAVRDAIGPDVELFIEGHGRFVLHEAVRIAVELERFDAGWFEEPLPPTQIKQYAQVKARTTVPIAGGEHFHNRYDFKPVFEHDVLHIVQPDVSMAGGFTELRKIAAIADMHGMVVAPHNSNSPLATTASAHASFALTNFKILETFEYMMEPFVYDALPGALRVKDGAIAMPTAPGIGVQLNDDVFEAHPPIGLVWDPIQEGWEKFAGER